MATAKRTLVVVIIATVAAAVAVIAVSSLSGPDRSQFAYLEQPRITRLVDQRMLVVEATGDPNVVAGPAFKLLFSAYFKASSSRWLRPPAPRARWPRSASRSGIEPRGRYALPVGDDVRAVSSVTTETGLQLRLSTWEYGDVAEILHVGPYNDEEVDIGRLLTFIASSGYEPMGDHEEEYVRGPGMVFAGDPRKYLTIIRLRIRPLTPTAVVP